MCPWGKYSEAQSILQAFYFCLEIQSKFQIFTFQTTPICYLLPLVLQYLMSEEG